MPPVPKRSAVLWRGRCFCHTQRPIALRGKVGISRYRLCNLVHCCRAGIGAMPSEPYCRLMLDRPSDEDVSRQILGVFMRHRIPATGTLQRNNFFEVRDGDFQRGINKAVANIGSPSICETATAINSRQRDTLSGG